MDRINLIVSLVQREEQVNGEYISGGMDRDTWSKTLQDVDERLSVLGVRLGYRPWESMVAGNSPKF